ncbi:MAG: hypothetical protein U1F11_13615 [Steroidobacteraceae bacterium]
MTARRPGRLPPPAPGKRRMQHAQRVRGQAMVEALVVIVLVSAALLLPWLDGESPAVLLLRAMLAVSRGYATWLALL